ncbi:MAG: LCP family protein [Clostridiales bacterium]|nr:LCP family protein [Candidatus Cacconaster stercorequi]
MKQKDTSAPRPVEQSNGKRRARRTGLDKFGAFAMLLLLLCSLALFARLIATEMLSNLYLIILMVVLFVINSIHIIVQMPLRRNKIGKLICGIIALILSAAMIYGMVAVGSVQSALSKITGKLIEKEVTAVLVMKDDSAQNIQDALQYKFGALSHSNTENTQGLVQKVQEETGTAISPTGYDTMTDLVDALYDDNVRAIILNEGYFDMIEDMENYKDFTEQTRVIYEFTTEREMETINNGSSLTKDCFLVYCSGIDARSTDLGIQSRSDVNILAVVNPKTHQILLLNTPRDYYLPLNMNGELDKLTHAGMYGISESMATLDDLYSTETPYYVRVNFNGLVDIVDALGGIDIESPCEFTTTNMEMPDEDGDGFSRESFYFPEGQIHVSGREALAFSRERYSFADGDNQRGRNQMTVIKAILKKATSPAVLSNYQDLLGAVSDSFITNISYKQITSLVKMQLKGMPDWNITSYAVSGNGDECYTYSAGNAWVMWPDDEMVATAKTLIQQVLNGETPVVPES